MTRRLPVPSPARRAAPAPSLLAALLLAGCASFDPLGPQSLQGAAQSAVVGRGNVFVRLAPDGTARVDGWVEDGISARSVLRTVAARPEVERVVDRLGTPHRFR